MKLQNDHRIRKKHVVLSAFTMLFVGLAGLAYVLNQSGLYDDGSETAFSGMTGISESMMTVGDMEPVIEMSEQACFEVVDNASIDCSDPDSYILSSNGLPEHTMMIGIEEGGWNGQWPEEQDYTGTNVFIVPRIVTIADDPALTVMNTAGVTANGIPFFFPHAPGNAAQSSCIYVTERGECFRDPVADGEMDVCGGHVGRGNDYHYHATPTCLIEQLPDESIVGYMLDGIPIYAEPLTGSVAYDGCAGYVSPEGLLHYSFMDEFPYVTDCMLGEYTEGPRTQGSSVYTGNIDAKNSGLISDFTEDENGCHTMTFSGGQSLYHCH